MLLMDLRLPLVVKTMFQSLIKLLFYLFCMSQICPITYCPSTVYVRYNTRLREQSLQRRQNLDPILVEDIDL